MKISQEQAAFLEVCEQNAELISQALSGMVSQNQGMADMYGEPFVSSTAGWERVRIAFDNAYNNLPEED